MIDFSQLYEKFQFFIAITVGSILQILFTTNLNTRLVLTILFSSIFVGLYIMHPLSIIICSKVNLQGDAMNQLENLMLSISGFTSIFIVRLILNLVKDNRWISTAVKARVAKAIGIDPTILLEKDNDDNKK